MLACAARRACVARAPGRTQQRHAVALNRHHAGAASAAAAGRRRLAATSGRADDAAAAAAAAAAPRPAAPLADASARARDQQPALPPSSPARRALGRLALVFVAAAAVLAVASLAAPEAALAAGKKAAAVAAAEPESGLSRLLSLVLHFDKHLGALVEANPRATYGVLFAIVFAETGLIVTPFLPGDSLLFAAGAFAGMGKLALWPLAATFAVAATLGDAVNYAIGKKAGRAALGKGWISPKHVAQTERYYAKYGPKTIVLARFVPIVRTFAPFVAGVGSMDYSKFFGYNVGGALLWTALFVGAGAAFGNLPVVKSNFKLVVLGIIVVSVIPVVIEVWNARREAAAAERGEGGAAA